MTDNQQETGHLKRTMKTRHLSMIALGGTIGTGLFVASGATISQAGPLGALTAYAVIGVMVYFLMTSLGEMATYMPVAGSFSVYADRFVDPAFGFAMGWNYWFSGKSYIGYIGRRKPTGKLQRRFRPLPDRVDRKSVV